MTEKILELNKEKTLFWGLVGVLFLCAGLYMYFINATVHNVVTRQNLEVEATQLTLKIGNQEFKYISKRNSITLHLAYSMGFKDAPSKTFVSRNPDTKLAFLSR